jgi:hypothetical protein
VDPNVRLRICRAAPLPMRKANVKTTPLCDSHVGCCTIARCSFSTSDQLNRRQRICSTVTLCVPINAASTTDPLVGLWVLQHTGPAYLHRVSAHNSVCTLTCCRTREHDDCCCTKSGARSAAATRRWHSNGFRPFPFLQPEETFEVDACPRDDTCTFVVRHGKPEWARRRGGR